MQDCEKTALLAPLDALKVLGGIPTSRFPTEKTFITLGTVLQKTLTIIYSAFRIITCVSIYQYSLVIG